ARVAGRKGTLPPKRKPKRDAPADPRPWPKLPDEIRDHVTLFLHAYLLEAQNAADRARRTINRIGKESGAQGQLDYWSNVCSAIKWLLHRAQQRQQYLALLAPDGDLSKCLRTIEPEV